MATKSIISYWSIFDNDHSINWKLADPNLLVHYSRNTVDFNRLTLGSNKAATTN
ncbi:hypothetical protein FC96_GL001632 [Secundilactobacillus kimchicus JCM 15530]|uniref:Uncharacterized protein n=1 Tax=Secundilactobacillus kimchicus JCM 15530 TaxID=1302272 RepID=A0A0R1HSH1_9LACO|nr:hypothetical protein FC96_GL001632 [Secundilactobacillus kimchicus JCM 15530]